MSCEGKELINVLADELPHVSFFYYTLQTLSKCYSKPFFRVSPEKLAEKSPRECYTEKQARGAIKRLVELELISAETASRRYTLVEVYRLKGTVYGTVNGTEKGTAFSRKNQPVFESEGTDEGTEKGTDQGNGLDVVDVDVVVLPSVLKSALRTVSSEPKAAPPLPDPKLEKELEHVKTVILKDLPLYLADPRLLEVDKTGSPRALSAVRAMKAAYPAVDVYSIVRRAHAWEFTNEKRRKKNRPRFWNSWAADDQDKGGVFRNGPITHERNERRPARPYDANAPRELPAPSIPIVKKNNDPTEAEYEADRIAILADIERRRQEREAREIEELPV